MAEFKLLFYRGNPVFPQQVVQALNLEGRANLVHCASEAELVQELTYDSIIIAEKDDLASALRCAGQEGCMAVLTMAQFLSHVSTLYSTHSEQPAFNAALAFLPQPLLNQVRSIFHCFGINAQVVSSFNQLNRIFDSAVVDYLVFNQDIQKINSASRTQVIRYIRSQQRKQGGLAVSVVKDFNHGSLYDDIASEIKDIANLMLSHYEYLQFLSRYLLSALCRRLEIRFQTQAARLKGRMPGALQSASRGLEKPLKDGKAIFQVLSSPLADKQLELEHEYQQALRRVYSCHSLLAHALDQLKTGDENNKRASFSFVKGRGDSALEESISIEKELLPNKKIVLPQRILNSNDSETIVAGGPR